MLLTVLSVPECPNVQVLLDRLRAVLPERDAGAVKVLVVDDDTVARRWGMSGSPTLLIDGVDPFPAGGRDGSLSCRLYRSARGVVSGAPRVDDLRAALGAAAARAAQRSGKAWVVAVEGSERGRLAPAAGGLRAVQQAALRAVARTGRVPRAAELDRAAAAFDRRAVDVLRDLAAGDFVTLDRAGELHALYPFSAVPTRHLVRIAAGPDTWSMCAVDALGIAPMLNRATRIDTTDPLTDEPVTVKVSAAAALTTAPEAVVFGGRRPGEGPTAQICCEVINLFASAHSATRWAALHPEVEGGILSIDEGFQLGRRSIGRLLEVMPHQDDGCGR